MALEAHGQAWTRKHDGPRVAYFPSVPVIAYPQNLQELVGMLQNPDGARRFRAAGSHWSLSDCAVSDGTFIETHDPLERQPALGRTLGEVLPECLSSEQLDALGRDRAAELGSLVHFESGKRIYQAYAELDRVADLNDQATLAGHIYHHYDHNAAYAGPWAFRTLGSAGGQTVVGAFSTGTHGGDFDRAPLADSVQALHLVVDGGRQFWIEPKHSAWGVPLTDDDRLRAVYGEDLEIRRSDQTFDAALVSVGRFGVIYSVVMRVEQQYSLYEDRVLRSWESVKDDISKRDSSLFAGPGDGTAGRFLQIAVCLAPYGFGDHLAGVTRRYTWPVGDAIGRAERVGTPGNQIDPKIKAARFSMAGRSHSYKPDADPLAQLCAHRSAIAGSLDLVIGELDDFITSKGAVVGAIVGAIAVPGPGAGTLGLLGLLAALDVALDLVRDVLNAIGDDTRVGELLDAVRDVLFELPDPISRAAGVFTWRAIAYAIFSGQQGDQRFTALSYAVMDQHDYKNVSCDVHVDSIEIFFDADHGDVVAFVDALLEYEAAQEWHGRTFVGYAALRFMGKTRALLGPQRWPRTVSLEVSCLRDVDGSQQLLDKTVQMALDPNYNGVLHWGQRHDADAYGTYLAFGQPHLDNPFYDDLTAWREVLADLTENGQRQGFSSDFSRRTGLEVL